MTAQLWVPGPMPGLNDIIDAAKGAGGTGRGYSRLKRQWTETVWALAKAARLPRFPGMVSLAFEWLEADKRRDPDGFSSAGKKLILDGLVAAGVVGGDGWKHIRCWSDYWMLAASKPLHNGQPGCIVTISDDDATVIMGGG